MAKSKRTRPIDIEIDKLTNSIQLVATGDVFNTIVTRAAIADKRLVKKKDWLFDWHVELAKPERQVYFLQAEHEPDAIQGLVSVEDQHDHVRVHLVESAGFNRGRDKKYFGVPGNLFAYACRLSFDGGYDGFVAFTAKTALVEHYKTMLGATVITKQLMQIEAHAARKLVEQYKL